MKRHKIKQTNQCTWMLYLFIYLSNLVGTIFVLSVLNIRIFDRKIIAFSLICILNKLSNVLMRKCKNNNNKTSREDLVKNKKESNRRTSNLIGYRLSMLWMLQLNCGALERRFILRARNPTKEKMFWSECVCVIINILSPNPVD